MKTPDFSPTTTCVPCACSWSYSSPNTGLRKQGINSTVVVFGSARILSQEEAQTRLAESETRTGTGETGPQQAEELTTPRCRLARHYEEARRFARMVSYRFQKEGARILSWSRAAARASWKQPTAERSRPERAPSDSTSRCRTNRSPTPTSAPSSRFRFRYFALRKMHFLLRARALVAFPGGYGTLDELFEVLTLVQTGKMARIPIVLVGSEFWRRVVDFDYLVDERFVTAQDVQLFTRVDAAEEAIAALEAFTAVDHPASRRSRNEGTHADGSEATGVTDRPLLSPASRGSCRRFRVCRV